ncbi:MAG: hypothetical protein KKA90_01255 [Nanoarchaeota archaeon]|nr:hypothetical protein [Nanoarchaeota archaeon]
MEFLITMLVIFVLAVAVLVIVASRMPTEPLVCPECGGVIHFSYMLPTAGDEPVMSVYQCSCGYTQLR